MTAIDSRGFTLVEAIVVIAITGIIAAVGVAFIRAPVEAYFDSVRRAGMSDTADTALRRINRDLRTALPNSIRIKQFPSSSGIFYLEYLQTSGGGRYRAEPDSAGNGNVLDFTTSVSAFDVIGPVPALSAGDLIVAYNLGPGSDESDAYTGGNSTAFSSVSLPATINIASKQFPFPPPGRRFQVVQYPVTYKCDPVARELWRFWGYTISTTQPTPPVTPNSALIAQNVSACEFRYDAVSPNPALQRTGTVSMSLELSQSGETVRLFQQVHVVNAP